MRVRGDPEGVGSLKSTSVGDLSPLVEVSTSLWRPWKLPGDMYVTNFIYLEAMVGPGPWLPVCQGVKDPAQDINRPQEKTLLPSVYFSERPRCFDSEGAQTCPRLLSLG